MIRHIGELRNGTPLLAKACAVAAIGLGIGAALMYVFDPASGRRRRAIARDRALGAANDVIDAARGKARHVRNRAEGAVAEARDALTPNRADSD